ncbi:uncharacterized protein BDZ99DRAFT_576105 [Mytilinidion resinicola]|uniref:Glycosyltransferase family 8 protein n=1 Tax=Mytilinidion resinicola TaxID=574789 RepID=A0A6A6Y4P6_9PEZI|nr:uncharacterized protein BDZ99DRAFT_576105 [Mytilinidion resinicola]KAF2803630.1 hypothetical protein BDZ99DRAFT_576105 [Mytilinidion resinicola]
MAISSSIVLLFTLILFLSGYVLQQRTVHSLQAAIKPRLPKPLPAPKPIAAPSLNVKWARPIGQRVGSDADFHEYIGQQTIDWSRLGYVQVVKEHVELCSAMMVFADLNRLRSPAKRILLFPRAWLQEKEGEAPSSSLTTSRRLLRAVARRYGVVLMPMQTIVEEADDSLPSSYSLASIYSLVEYERVIHLAAPGVILDAGPLDSLLAFSKSQPLAAFPATSERNDISTSLFLVHPTVSDYRKLRELRATEPMSDLNLFRKSFSAPESLLSTWSLSLGNLVYESGTLRDAIDGFNATVFIEATAYVRLSDPELPGPEYDVPYYDRVRLRPQNEEAGAVWAKLYETFRERRMEICGLDLETWTTPVLQAEEASQEEMPEEEKRPGKEQQAENEDLQVQDPEM